MTGASFADVVALLVAVAAIVASALLGDRGVARRALAVVAVLFGATLVVGGTIRLVPGDPVAAILGEDAPADAREKLARALGLVDDAGNPAGFVAQYGRFVRGVGASVVLAVAPASTEAALAAHLPDEPRSFRDGQPVRKLLAARFPATLVLAGAALLVAATLGPALGIVAAVRRRSVWSALAMGFAFVGVAIPRFWLGPLLLLAFSVRLGWLPVSGNDDGLASLVLPALSLGTALAAALARMTRASMLEVLADDSIRTARAKGLAEHVVVRRHALRQALVPVLTVLGLQLGALLAGAVVTEKVFAWPGVGLLLVEAIRRLDVPVVQGVVLAIAATYVLVNLATDAAYRLVDPRLRRSAA